MTGTVSVGGTYQCKANLQVANNGDLSGTISTDYGTSTISGTSTLTTISSSWTGGDGYLYTLTGTVGLNSKGHLAGTCQITNNNNSITVDGNYEFDIPLSENAYAEWKFEQFATGSGTDIKSSNGNFILKKRMTLTFQIL